MKIGIITVSDSCSKGKRVDESGETIRKMVKQFSPTMISKKIVPDEISEIIKTIKAMIDRQKLDLVITTGGTGLGPRDVTPEAVRKLIDKEIPGIGEIMRVEGIKKSPRAILSRSVAGIRKHSLIISLPGSPKGVAESLSLVLDIVPHALSMARGEGHS